LSSYISASIHSILILFFGKSFLENVVSSFLTKALLSSFQLILQPEQFLKKLMKDWYDPKSKDYGLVKKLSNKDKFKKLYEIAEECPKFNTLCLRIVYQYCYEKRKNFGSVDGEEYVNELNTLHCEVFSDEQTVTNKQAGITDQAESTEQAVTTGQAKKTEQATFMIELLKVIVIHWVVNKPNNDDYKTSKEKVEKAVRGSQEKAFFDLVFMIHENLIDMFEIELEKFLKEQKNLHGDFFQHSTTPNLRLLNALIKRKRDMKVTQVLFRVCPFIEYNSTILTTFEEYQQFQIFIVGEFRNETFKEIVSLCN
jgi:hypothetical protein